MIIQNQTNSTGQSIKELQQKIKRLEIKSVVNGTFSVTSQGTTIVCSPRSTQSSGSAITNNPVLRWF